MNSRQIKHLQLENSLQLKVLIREEFDYAINSIWKSKFEKYRDIEKENFQQKKAYTHWEEPARNQTRKRWII